MFSALAVATPRERVNFDFAWRHHLGDLPPAALQPNYNDSSWALVDAPHDMLIAAERSPASGSLAMCASSARTADDAVAAASPSTTTGPPALLSPPAAATPHAKFVKVDVDEMDQISAGCGVR